MTKNIYGMGNPLLDISADVDESVLQKYGLKPANAILAEEQHLPLYKELSERPDVQYIPGGATLNSIRVAKWMLQDKSTCSYVGCIGNDKFGSIMKEKTQKEGLNVPFMVTDKQPTGTCAVLITGKERSLVANLAAANCFTESHIQTPEVQKAIKEAEIYYIAGFFLTVSVPSVLEVAKHAAETNKIFCVNLSAPFIIQFFGKQLEETMPYIDILFSNDDEAKEYGKSKNIEGEIKDIATYIMNLPKINLKRSRMVIITRGEKPAIVATAEGVIECAGQPIPSEEITDTNGAGDAFVGGFLSQLALDLPLKRCLQAGHYAAGVIIQHSGCTFPPKPDFQ